jgi:hypothetical protein
LRDYSVAIFFEKAACYGGTALRIFYGLDRYSDNLDFSLLKVDPAFSMEPYLKGMVAELESLGVKVSVRTKIRLLLQLLIQPFLNRILYGKKWCFMT